MISKNGNNRGYIFIQTSKVFFISFFFYTCEAVPILSHKRSFFGTPPASRSDKLQRLIERFCPGFEAFFVSLSPCSGTRLFCHCYYGKPAPSAPSPSVTPIRMEGPCGQRLLLLLKNWKDSPPIFFFPLFFSPSKLPFKYCVRNRVWEGSQSWLCKASPSLFYTKFCLTFQPSKDLPFRAANKWVDIVLLDGLLRGRAVLPLLWIKWRNSLRNGESADAFHSLCRNRNRSLVFCPLQWLQQGNKPAKEDGNLLKDDRVETRPLSKIFYTSPS